MFLCLPIYLSRKKSIYYETNNLGQSGNENPSTEH
jgi:hypothetical protein